VHGNSETPGSKLTCSSPGFIAAYHVLLRLLMPRHPPYTLIILITFFLKMEVVFGNAQHTFPKQHLLLFLDIFINITKVHLSLGKPSIVIYKLSKNDHELSSEHKHFGSAY
jgi:hypothetical protein